MRNVSEKKICRENQNTYFTPSNIWRKSCLLWDNVEKYSRVGQATDDNLAHALCKLDTWGYIHTLRICAANYFFPSIIFKQIRFNVTLYAHCLSCCQYLHVEMGRWWTFYLNNITQILFSFTSSQVSFKEHENCCSANIIILFIIIIIIIIMEFDICYLFIHCNLVYIRTWF